MIRNELYYQPILLVGRRGESEIWLKEEIKNMGVRPIVRTFDRKETTLDEFLARSIAVGAIFHVNSPGDADLVLSLSAEGQKTNCSC